MPVVLARVRFGQGRVILPVLIAFTLLAPDAAQAADEWQVGTAPSFLSGKYGTDTRSDVFFTPVTARRLFADGDITVVLPFTCIRGSGDVTIINGTPARTGQSAPQPGREQSGTRPSGNQRTGSPSATSSPESSAAPGEQTACGLGDVVVRARYYVVDERGWLPTVAIRGHVKLPSADAERGLGTGRADEGVGVELTRTLAGGILLMADAGYTFIGKPAGVRYNNNWWYDAGVGRGFANDVINLSAFYEEYRAVVPGLVNARDILAAVTLKGAGGWRVQLAAQFGLSDGSPDHGATIGASRRF